MTGKPVRLGIVGANPARGWARDAHLPALRKLPQFAIAAVSARSQDIADAAAAHFDAPRGFGDSLEMVRDPDVDLVVVTVKVPEHHAIVMAALNAGKHVLCEWPLGRNLAEVQEMAAAVPEGTLAATNLQGPFAPTIRQATALVREGRIGTPRMLRAFSTAGAWSASVQPFYAYLQDKQTGATMETIGGGHTLAAIEALVGDYVELNARNTTHIPRPAIAGTDETVDRTCADHMLVLGSHQSGCVSTLEVVGGTPERRNLFEIEGDDGWIRVTGTGPGVYQIAPLQIEASFPLDPLPEPAAPGLAGPAANVAEIYARITADLEDGTRTAPDFARAVRLTQLLDAIDAASATGNRQSPYSG